MADRWQLALHLRQTPQPPSRASQSGAKIRIGPRLLHRNDPDRVGDRLRHLEGDLQAGLALLPTVYFSFALFSRRMGDHAGFGRQESREGAWNRLFKWSLLARAAKVSL